MIYLKIAILLSILALWWGVVSTKIENYEFYKKRNYNSPLIETLKTHPMDIIGFIIINLILIGLYTL